MRICLISCESYRFSSSDFFFFFFHFKVALLRSQHINIDKVTHARAAKCHDLIYPSRSESKIKKLLIGQSFLVVLCTFLLARVMRFHKKLNPQLVLGSSQLASFLSSEIVGIVFTVCLAQLLPSLLAKNYPVEFLNIPGIYTIIYTALLIENMGVVEFTYLIVKFSELLCFTAHSNQYQHPSGSVNSADAMEENLQDSSSSSSSLSSSKTMNTLQFIKYSLSSVLTASALGFVFYCILSGFSSFPAPISAQILLFFLAIVIVFYCEGLKIGKICLHAEFTAI